jgi:hypothetical protein
MFLGTAVALAGLSYACAPALLWRSPYGCLPLPSADRSYASVASWDTTMPDG